LPTLYWSLVGTSTTAIPNAPLPEKVKKIEVTVEGGVKWSDRLTLPYDPFISTIGTSAAAWNATRDCGRNCANARSRRLHELVFARIEPVAIAVGRKIPDIERGRLRSGASPATVHLRPCPHGRIPARDRRGCATCRRRACRRSSGAVWCTSGGAWAIPHEPDIIPPQGREIQHWIFAQQSRGVRWKGDDRRKA
jgi:hypothetical protein